MVFRAEGEFDRVATDGCADGASDGRAGDAEVEIVEEDRNRMPLKVSVLTEVEIRARDGSPPYVLPTPTPGINLHEYEKKRVTEKAFRKPLILKGAILVVLGLHRAA